MPKVLIAPQTLAGLEGPHLQALREANFELIYPPRPVLLTEGDLLHQLQGVSAVLAGSEPYTRRVIEAHPGLRVIARTGVGFDAVDLAAATERGIAVTTTPGTNQES